jgi:hypothetical protein
VHRFALVPLVALCLAVAACGDDQQAKPSDASNAVGDPTNAVAEVGDIDLGYDRDDWDPEAVERAMEVAGRLTATTVGCVNPTVTPFATVRDQMYRQPQLPMPAAFVQCTSIPVAEGEDGEDLTIQAFADTDAKDIFIAANEELLCERGRQLGLDSAGRESVFDGVPYVDVDTVIVQPDSWEVRDELARQLGAASANMCPDVTADKPATTTTG